MFVAHSHHLLLCSHCVCGSDYPNATTHPIHVEFFFDENRYQRMYSTWLHWLHKAFVGGLTYLGFSKAHAVGLAPSLTTKGLVVMCELPAIVVLMWFTITGPVYLDATQHDPTVVLAFGDAFILLGLASKLMVARFWRAYAAHLELGAGHVFVDPVRSDPLASLAVVAVAALWQATSSFLSVYFARTNTGNPLTFSWVNAGLVTPVYFATIIFFMHSGVNVLRSLTDNRTLVMSSYLVSSGMCMTMHVSAIACFAGQIQMRSEIYFGILTLVLVSDESSDARAAMREQPRDPLVVLCKVHAAFPSINTVCMQYVSRAGTAMCCISIFHAHADSAFVFLEAQNTLLAENVRRLEETAELTALLTSAERVHQEKLVKKEKDFVANALHELRNPLGGIVQMLEYLFEALKGELTSDVAFELRCIEQCTDHMQVRAARGRKREIGRLRTTGSSRCAVALRRRVAPYTLVHTRVWPPSPLFTHVHCGSLHCAHWRFGPAPLSFARSLSPALIRPLFHLSHPVRAPPLLTPRSSFL